MPTLSVSKWHSASAQNPEWTKELESLLFKVGWKKRHMHNHYKMRRSPWYLATDVDVVLTRWRLARIEHLSFPVFHSFFMPIQERHAENLHTYGQTSVPLWILDRNQWSTRLHLQLGEEQRVVTMTFLICISNPTAVPFPPPAFLYHLLCHCIGNLILNFWSLESSGAAWPCWHLILDFWPPEPWENKFLLF